MSEILVKNVSDKTYPNTGRYYMAELESGKHSVIVIVRSNGSLQVVVQNASNRCWKGLGKTFPSLDEALKNYKTSEIREMISHAVELSKGGQQ